MMKSEYVSKTLKNIWSDLTSVLYIQRPGFMRNIAACYLISLFEQVIDETYAGEIRTLSVIGKARELGIITESEQREVLYSALEIKDRLMKDYTLVTDESSLWISRVNWVECYDLFLNCLDMLGVGAKTRLDYCNIMYSIVSASSMRCESYFVSKVAKDIVDLEKQVNTKVVKLQSKNVYKIPSQSLELLPDELKGFIRDLVNQKEFMYFIDEITFNSTTGFHGSGCAVMSSEAELWRDEFTQPLLRTMEYCAEKGWNPDFEYEGIYAAVDSKGILEGILDKRVEGIDYRKLTKDQVLKEIGL